MKNEASNKTTMLIVDSDLELINTLSNRCEEIGLHVSTASNAREASLIFEIALPDLLMFNIDMAAGNNRLFIDCLADYEDTRIIPMILLCDQSDLPYSQMPDTVLGYCVHKNLENWWRIEMFIYELSNLAPSFHGNNSSTN